MSTKKSRNGTVSNSDTDRLHTTTQALRRIAADGERVTLAQIAGESGLAPATTERVMGYIERVSPLSARRVVEPGADVAWEMSL